jgi:CPA2 family monovalent cation:H+ antiporter-2
LSRYEVSRDKIESFIEEIRSDGYEMFRSYSREPYCSANLSLITEDISTLKVCPGSPAADRPLGDLELEALHIKPLAVHRGVETLSNPQRDLVLLPEDVVILMGQEENINKIAELFSSEPK